MPEGRRRARAGGGAPVRNDFQIVKIELLADVKVKSRRRPNPVGVDATGAGAAGRGGPQPPVLVEQPKVIFY